MRDPAPDFDASNLAGSCLWCGRRLRATSYAPTQRGDYGDGFFCGLRCGWRFGVESARTQLRFKAKRGDIPGAPAPLTPPVRAARDGSARFTVHDVVHTVTSTPAEPGSYVLRVPAVHLRCSCGWQEESRAPRASVRLHRDQEIACRRTK